MWGNLTCVTKSASTSERSMRLMVQNAVSAVVRSCKVCRVQQNRSRQHRMHLKCAALTLRTQVQTDQLGLGVGCRLPRLVDVTTNCCQPAKYCLSPPTCSYLVVNKKQRCVDLHHTLRMMLDSPPTPPPPQPAPPPPHTQRLYTHLVVKQRQLCVDLPHNAAHDVGLRLILELTP